MGLEIKAIDPAIKRAIRNQMSAALHTIRPTLDALAFPLMRDSQSLEICGFRIARHS